MQVSDRHAVVGHRDVLGAGLGGFIGTLLGFFGLVSMFVAAIFIVGQGHYKRMLAYSTLGQLGEIALVLGMGTWLAIFDNRGDVTAAISKRPDTTPLIDLLAEQGDEIFADCDGIAIEFDLEKDTVKQILHYAKKYRKKGYAAVSNMSIAMERRDFLQQIDCFVCNQQEAGILFSDEYDHMGPEEMCRTLAANVGSARIPCMVVTMGDKGAVYACADGESGIVPAKKVNVIDTTGAGDAFFAGTVIGRAYGKTMAEACGIGSRLAASVICTAENVCPRFRPQEFGLDVPVVD